MPRPWIPWWFFWGGFFWPDKKGKNMTDVIPPSSPPEKWCLEDSIFFPLEKWSCNPSKWPKINWFDWSYFTPKQMVLFHYNPTYNWVFGPTVHPEEIQMDFSETPSANYWRLDWLWKTFQLHHTWQSVQATPEETKEAPIFVHQWKAVVTLPPQQKK